LPEIGLAISFGGSGKAGIINFVWDHTQPLHIIFSCNYVVQPKRTFTYLKTLHWHWLRFFGLVCILRCPISSIRR